MAHLSFNPDGHQLRDGRTLVEVIADEEYLEPEEPVKEKADKEEKKIKFMSFELDMTYPRTPRGFIRILQVLLLLVAFVCLIITPEVGLGIYSFYCVVLVFGALISGFLFFTILAGSRSGTCCGLTWVKIELLYFVLFGLIIFVGACLAASNNSTSNPALNAGAAFGFIACITFGIYIFWTWKDYKKPPDNDDEEKKEEEEDEQNKDLESQGDDSVSGPAIAGSKEHRRTGSTVDPSKNKNGDWRVNGSPNQQIANGNLRDRPDGYLPNGGTRSLERPLSIISRNELIDPKYRKEQRRRHRSGSDKDSAYSEGSMVDRNRSLPTKIRRTASAREERIRNSMEKPRHAGDRRVTNAAGRERRSHELKLSAVNLQNQEEGSRRKAVPNWLRKALDEDEHARPGPGRRLVSTMPEVGRKNEFPLLHMSDEESIAYPSVSQTLRNTDARWNNQRGLHQRGAHRQHAHRGRRGQTHGKTRRCHGPHHAGVHHRGGKRLHAHGHRHLHMNGKRPVHGHHRGHDRHARTGRGHRGAHHNVPHERVRPEDDVFLRRMVENDQLVHRSNRIGLGKNHPDTKRRVIPEQPTSIQFPEHSRWGDNEPVLPEHGGTNTLIEKYLNS